MNVERKPSSMQQRSTKIQVMDVQAVSRFITNHYAAGVLPGQMIKHLKKNGLNIINLPESKNILSNKLSLSYLENRTYPAHIKTAIDELSNIFA